MKKTLSAALCAILMLTALPAALAEEAQALNSGDTVSVSDGGTHSYTGSVEVSGTGTAVSVDQKTTVNIADGNISVTGNESAAAAVQNESALNVSGDVSADGNALYASAKSTITVTGDVDSEKGDAVTAFSGSTVTVDGDVAAGDDGVIARPGESLKDIMSAGAEVTVGGDITADEEGITAQNSTVVAEGSVTAGRDGIDAFRSNVYVSGDVEADRIGAGIMVNGISSADNILFVEGTVSGGTEGALVIMDYTPIPFLINNAGENNLPTVVVGKLESEGALVKAVTVTKADLSTFEVTEYSDNQDLTDLMIAKISYIVATDETVTTDASETFTSIDGTEYKVAHEGDTIIVTPVAKEGYEITGLSVGEYAQYAKNEDGTYTVTVMRGGDLVFSAIMIEIPAEADPESSVSNGSSTAAVKKIILIKTALWSIKQTNADGTVSLISAKAYTEAELEDLQALLVSMLTEEELALLVLDENGLPVITVEDGHLIIMTAAENAEVFTANV